MGLLDGLKQKISESEYSDKISSGLNKLGEGLGTGSEKIQNFASSIKEHGNNQMIESSDVQYVQTNQNEVASYNTVSSRSMFSVNENDTNETRQMKEVLQDTNEVVQSVNQIVNGEAVRNFSEAAKIIATSYSAYKLREQEIEKELKAIELQNQNNLEKMKFGFQNLKPIIDEQISNVKNLLNDLRAYEGKQLTDKELAQYNNLVTLITNLSGQTMSLCETIMG